VEQRAVRDRNVITAKGYAFVDLALLVADYLKIYTDDIRRYNELEQVYIKNEEIKSRLKRNEIAR